MSKRPNQCYVVRFVLGPNTTTLVFNERPSKNDIATAVNSYIEYYVDHGSTHEGLLQAVVNLSESDISPLITGWGRPVQNGYVSMCEEDYFTVA
jgi:hypothetical protein